MKNEIVISLSFGNYLKGDGGVDKAIREHQEMFNNAGVSYFHISPVSPGAFNYPIIRRFQGVLFSVVIDGRFYGLYDESDLSQLLIRINTNTTVKGIHIHHIKKFRYSFVKKILLSFPGKKVFFIHDYYSICEHPNLLKNGIKFCGSEKKKSSSCKDCIYSKTIEEHQRFMRSMLKDFSDMSIVAPSEIAASIWQATFSEYISLSQIQIIPHQIPHGTNTIVPTVRDKIKIAFLGRFGDNKGAREWKQVVDTINSNELPYEMYYLGFSNVDLENVNRIAVRVDKDHPNMMIDTLRNLKINCSFLWSICPETYSYAYFEAYSANTFIISNEDSGNIAAMINKNRNGIVLKNISELIELLKNNELFKKMISSFYSSSVFGPLQYESNKDILDLVDSDGYKISCQGLTKKIPGLLKTIVERKYSKKNKIEIHHFK